MTTGTLNGENILRASVTIPRCGIWYADIEIATPKKLDPGDAKVQIADLELTGTLLDKGGPYATRGYYSVIGGKGGWQKPLKAQAHRSQAGVKFASIVTDAAKQASETLGSIPDKRVGPAFVWPCDGAELARVLDLVAPEAWYVDEKGVTQFGARAASTWSVNHRLLDAKPDRNWVLVSAESIAALLPGAQLEGLEAATVRHELTSQRLQTLVWGTEGLSVADRFVQRIARIVRALMRPYWYHGVYSYRVVGGSGGYLDLQPEDTSVGLPPLQNVPVRVGAYGARGTPANNCGVLVGFKNGRPSDPYVHSFEGEWSSASIPTESDIFATLVKIGDAAATALARADKVNAELGKLQTAHNTHIHVLAIAAASGSGGTGTSSPPAITYTPADVSCTKAMGT